MSHNQFREDAPFYDTSLRSPRYPPSDARLAEDPLGSLPIELEGSPVASKPSSTPPTPHTFSKYGRTFVRVGPGSNSLASTSERPRAPTMTRIRAVEPWIEPIGPSTLLQKHMWTKSGILAPKPVRPNQLSDVVEKLEKVVLSMTYEDIERMNQDARIEMLEADNERFRAREDLCHAILAGQVTVSPYVDEACPGYFAPNQSARSSKWPMKRSFKEFSQEVQEDVNWMQPYLDLLDYNASYDVQDHLRCKVGRPPGKVLNHLDGDDKGTRLCYRHKAKEFVENFVKTIPRGDPWKCPQGRLGRT